MRFFVSLLFLASFQAFAWEASVKMSDSLEMTLNLTCEEGETLCEDTCGVTQNCAIEAGSCKNCIGANTFISHFYREVGRLFQSTKRMLSPEDSAALLARQKKLIFLEASGPYNIYSGVGDLRTERHFESLCQGQFFSRPIVIATLDARSRVQRASHVICHGDFGAEIFEMSHAGD